MIGQAIRQKPEKQAGVIPKPGVLVQDCQNDGYDNKPLLQSFPAARIRSLWTGFWLLPQVNQLIKVGLSCHVEGLVGSDERPVDWARKVGAV